MTDERLIPIRGQFGKQPKAIRSDEDEDAEGESLWGDDGPKVGQVITIRGTSMQTRWTGTHWELVK